MVLEYQLPREYQKMKNKMAQLSQKPALASSSSKPKIITLAMHTNKIAQPPSTDHDDFTCTSAETCKLILKDAATLSLFHSDVRTGIYDPRFSPPFFNNDYFLTMEASFTTSKSTSDSRSISPASVPLPDPAAPTLVSNSVYEHEYEQEQEQEQAPELTATMAAIPSQTLEDYLGSRENDVDWDREREEASTFAQYRVDCHGYLHGLAMAEGISLDRAWDEMQIRRWRWGLLEGQAKGGAIDTMSSRRGAIGR